MLHSSSGSLPHVQINSEGSPLLECVCVLWYSELVCLSQYGRLRRSDCCKHRRSEPFFSNCSFRSAVIKRLFSMQAIRPPFYLSLVSTIYIQLQHSYTHSKIPHNLLFPAYCDRSLDMVNEFFKQNLLYFRHFELEKKNRKVSLA